MIYNVAGLLTAREGATRLVSIEDGEILTDRHHFTQINGPVRLLRTDRTVLVSASVSAVVADTCGRCLSPAKLIIDTEFDEEFLPANRDLIGDRTMPREAEFDPALEIDLRNMLDMTEALAQSLSIAVPVTPLCRQDCAGLCFRCFADRNITPCTCDENPIDPRWQSLAELGVLASNSTE